jgi:hypothetical protein
MSVTNYAINKMLDYDFGSVSYTPPGTYYMGLSTTTSAASSIAISGSLMTEPSSGSYARIAISNDKTSFSVASTGSLVSIVDMTFAESSGSWGTITNVGLWDNATTGSGNLWFFQQLPTSKVIQANTIVTFSASSIYFSITN